MHQVGDKDKEGYICRYINGPVAVWEAPDEGYGIYLTVKDGDFIATLYNHRMNYDEAVSIADRAYDKLNKYGKTILE